MISPAIGPAKIPPANSKPDSLFTTAPPAPTKSNAAGKRIVSPFNYSQDEARNCTDDTAPCHPDPY
jgi:hypothetical protein